MVVILMGVSGAGKTSVGRRLAQQLGWLFVEGDDFHSPESVARMAAGVPLTDEERAPWLALLREQVQRALESGEDMVLTCSALRQRYRQLLTVDPAQVRWVHLTGPRELLRDRLAARTGHFMPPSLLDSQLEALEAPHDALQVDVTPGPEAVVATIRASLGL